MLGLTASWALRMLWRATAGDTKDPFRIALGADGCGAARYPRTISAGLRRRPAPWS